MVEKMMACLQLLPQPQFRSNPTKSPRPHPKDTTHFFTTISYLPNTSIVSDSGLLFREKLIYLQNHIHVNPSKALSQNPEIRSFPISFFKSVVSCLSSFGIERSALGRILDMHPQLLTSDPHLYLYPVFGFLLNEVCIPYHDIRKSIIRCPRLLISSVEGQLRPALQFLRNLGFVGKHGINCQTTLLLVSSVEGTLVPKIQYLQSLKFSQLDVARMVVRSPGLLTFSIENNFKPKLAYFLEEMKGDLVELKRFPQYFSFSLERKIRPRHQLLLKHGLWMPLDEMLKVNDGEFNSRLIEMQLH